MPFNLLLHLQLQRKMTADDKLVNFTKKVVIIISQCVESVMSTMRIIILKQLPLLKGHMWGYHGISLQINVFFFSSWSLFFLIVAP